MRSRRFLGMLLSFRAFSVLEACLSCRAFPPLKAFPSSRAFPAIKTPHSLGLFPLLNASVSLRVFLSLEAFLLACAVSGRPLPVHAEPLPSEARQILSAPTDTAWRALWVAADHLTSRKRIERTVEAASELGATDLLIQVRTRGDALYRSAYAPACRALTPREGPATITLKHDPLWDLLDLAHARGLRVHAWFNVFVAWSLNEAPPLGHVLGDHPDWALRLPDGRSTLSLSAGERRGEQLEGAFLAPGLAEVRAHLVNLVEELARYYALDGIHFDYVRYPSTACIDPGEPLAVQSTEPDSARARRQRESVSAFVRDAAAAARAARPGLLVTAAVFPDPEDAYAGVRQDWVRWLLEGWIDRALPMAYTDSIDRLEKLRLRWDQAGADSLRVVAGLAVYLNDGAALERQITWARRRSPGGVALFALEHLEENGARMKAARRALSAPRPRAHSTSSQ